MTATVLYATVAWQPAQAHPLAPALLELRELGSARYEVLWRTSVTRMQGTDVRPQLPDSCHAVAPMQTVPADQSVEVRWQVVCPAGLAGQTLSVTGLDRSRINVILRLESRDGEVVTALLDAATPRYAVPGPEVSPPVFGKYLGLGTGHLLSGLDHILFVSGLLLLVRRVVPLVATITAFTLGHSVTLALATLGLVRLNPVLTELGIALSIVVLALELVRPRPNSMLRQRPWLMAGGFGLLHGLGFAGALSGVGLPAQEIPLALLAFNLGIEAGQLMVVALLAALAAAWNHLPRKAARAPELARAVPAYFIGSLGAYWCIERAVALAIA